MATISPATREVKLHGNPSGDPIYSQTVNSEFGELQLACPKATRAMVALMDMQAVMGGAASHFGGPAAFAESMSAVHGYFFAKAKEVGKLWHELFHFVNDAGHCENGLYALKTNYNVAGLKLESLKGFRSFTSALTGHGEAHLFPEGVYMSNGPLGSGLPQAQGLAAAEKLSGQNRTSVVAISDGACMEGEAKEALAAIPGLFQNGKLSPFVVIISDNNTKLSGRIDADSFSMRPTFDSLAALGWETTHLKDGHDLQKVYSAVEVVMSKATNKPQALWLQTIKGKGVKSTEDSASGGHGFPLKKPDELKAFVKEIYSGETVPTEFNTWCDEMVASSNKKVTVAGAPSTPKEKVQVGVTNALVACAEQGLPVVSISADLQGSTGVAGFRKKFPERSFEVGVAEANMINMAVGMSKQGYIPVVDTFAQFAVTKGALPLIMSGLSEAPVIGVFSHTGFQDAADGASHQSLAYIAMVSSIPKVETYCLTCSSEAFELISQAVKTHKEELDKGVTPPSRLFFLGRETFLPKFTKGNYKLGKAQVVSTSETKDKMVTLVASGSLLSKALEAQNLLLQKGIGSFVVNPSVINKPDIETISNCLKKSEGKLITVDDHRVIGGMGSLLIHSLAQEGVDFKSRSLGVGDEFGRSAYKADELYNWAGLSEKHIAAAAIELF